MRVLVNTLCAEGPRTGVGVYTSELVRCLRELAAGEALGNEESPPGTTIECFPTGWMRRARGLWVRQAELVERAGRPPRPWAWLGKEARRRLLRVARQAGRAVVGYRFRLTAGRGRFDLYHEPNFIPLPCEVLTVATVHDLSALLHPEWHPAERIAYFENSFHKGLKRCRHLFAISEFGKREIVEHLGWKPEDVTVTYMGVRPGLRRLEGAELAAGLAELDLKPGYLLHTGTLEPRKNVLMLMRAYCGLPAAVRERHPLVLVGGWGWNSDTVHDYLRNEASHKGVRWLGYAADRHFAALYSGARALAFPTLYEGFGMPTIEMMACGGAVLASTAGAVAETVGGQAHLLEPHDEAGWRDALLRVCRDDDWWQSLRRGAEQAAARFSWRRCAADTLAAYRRIAGGRAALRRAA